MSEHTDAQQHFRSRRLRTWSPVGDIHRDLIVADLRWCDSQRQVDCPDRRGLRDSLALVFLPGANSPSFMSSARP